MQNYNNNLIKILQGDQANLVGTIIGFTRRVNKYVE